MEHSMRLFVLLLLTFTGLSQAGSLNYIVERNGKAIGTHSFDFSGSGDQMLVDVNSNMVVKIGFIPVYKFIHNGREIWSGGLLTSYESSTNDNGTNKFLKFNNNIAESNLGVNEFQGKQVMPASLWNIESISANKLMNTLDGKIMNIDVKDIGTEEVLTTSGNIINAEHYSVTGDLERDLWFDEANRLVHVLFKGQDGSNIEYILEG
jgi:hypothetical protein